MAELCKYSGQILYRIDGNTVKDFYGRPLYIIDGDKLLKWDSRSILYRFDGYTIKDFYGRSLYSFDGTNFKDFYGRILYTYKNNSIAKFASIAEYVVRPAASVKEVAIFILLFVIG